MSALTDERLRAIEQSGWGEEFRLVQPHNLAFWVYCLLVVFGAIVLSGQVSIAAAAYSGALTTGIIAFGLLRSCTSGTSTVRIATRRCRAGSPPPGSCGGSSPRPAPSPCSATMR